jgi:hypothetical protein
MGAGGHGKDGAASNDGRDAHAHPDLRGPRTDRQPAAQPSRQRGPRGGRRIAAYGLSPRRTARRRPREPRGLADEERLPQQGRNEDDERKQRDGLDRRLSGTTGSTGHASQASGDRVTEPDANVTRV